MMACAGETRFHNLTASFIEDVIRNAHERMGSGYRVVAVRPNGVLMTRRLAGRDYNIHLRANAPAWSYQEDRRR